MQSYTKLNLERKFKLYSIVAGGRFAKLFGCSLIFGSINFHIREAVFFRYTGRK
jgi:hypothetical protein